ncbi:TPA: PhzF family phenazine biosynthesis protein [Pseudomonas aeruginosa]|nr:PhzF family phenazine biosynthesis protein [Pseudomonas aeruginosa]
MKCTMVDVFSSQRFSGNGLAIFSDCDHLSSAEMQVLTQEMRQFESIFLACEAGVFSARIFTMEEELDFAGHPLLGLAYHLHDTFGERAQQHEWQVKLNRATVTLRSGWRDGQFIASMSQGRPSFGKTLSREEAAVLYSALGLDAFELPGYPAEVVSTGLPYVVLPVSAGLEAVEFRVADLSPLLAPHGAKFLYVVDVPGLEGRTWDNAGKVEDIATGSAAGPVGAYLYKHGLSTEREITLNQGRFLGRPSRLQVKLLGDGAEILDVQVSGHVVKVADVCFAG